MNITFLSLFISVVFFLAFLFFLLKGIRKRSRKSFSISTVFFVAAVVAGIWFGQGFVSRFYNKLKHARFDNPLRKKSGEEIYFVLFGRSSENCVKILNQVDQIVPRLDCCVWLEFKTCSAELDRVISRSPYEVKYLTLADSSVYTIRYSPRPEWFKPHILSDTIIMLRNYDPQDPNRDKILFFSKDSTHAFYCDMAD